MRQHFRILGRRVPSLAVGACLLAGLMALGACGQKGALYLPAPAPAASAPASSSK
ncbi:LPS translocon maturation chaperone LptM [Methylibium rhizosphaerae]|uniref:LPS translocon maturation chaperone LptM n=1 Tax=Methylibium rhizosphaerae TaxID=2570323 RepID=UPI003CCC4A58